MGHKELTVHQRRLLNVIRAHADDRGRASIGQAADRRPATFRALERRGLIEVIRVSTAGWHQLRVWHVRLLQPEEVSGEGDASD
jgi:hypothetical protein